MKKNSLIFCAVLISFTLMAFGYKNWQTPAEIATPTSTCKPTPTCGIPALNLNLNLGIACQPLTVPDLLYKVDNRFIATITKEELDKATSILDILPKEATQSLSSYTEVEVSTLDDHRVITTSMGKNEQLNDDQRKLLQSTDYSSNIFVGSICYKKNMETGQLEYYHLTYFISVVPSKIAQFENGHASLIEYLKENSKEKTSIITKEGLKPGKVNFTITKDETIENVLLSSSSGYLSVDETLVELIKNMPQKWQAARNAKGEKVDQTFTFFFGLEGC